MEYRLIITLLGWVRGNTKAYVHQKELAYQSSVDSLKTSVSEGKALIAAAVTDKGVSTAADATFQTITTNIGKISTKAELYKDYFTTGNSNGTFQKTLLNDNDGNFVIALGRYTNTSIGGSEYIDVSNDYGGIILGFTNIPYIIYAYRSANNFMRVMASEYALDYVYLTNDNKTLNYKTGSGYLIKLGTEYTIWYL